MMISPESFYSEYLERAKEALVEAGGVYVPFGAEMRAAAFEDSIPSICKLVFSIGGFSSGYETRTKRYMNWQMFIIATILRKLRTIL